MDSIGKMSLSDWDAYVQNLPLTESVVDGVGGSANEVLRTAIRFAVAIYTSNDYERADLVAHANAFPYFRRERGEETTKARHYAIRWLLEPPLQFHNLSPDIALLLNVAWSVWSEDVHPGMFYDVLGLKGE